MSAVATLMPEGSGPPPRSEHPFRPQGRFRQFWGTTHREQILSGPAGSGKSRAILEYLFAIASKSPNVRILIVRQTRASLTESALVTFERHVVPGSPPWITNQKRRVRQSYVLPNGSELITSGLDNPDRVMSTEYDIIYVMETREIVEGDWETLMSRLRNTALSFRFIIGDTNPDGPAHWIKERERSGKLHLLETRHEDNPAYWDEAAGDYTPMGREYMETLDAMTGMRKKRLRFGLWVGGENMVYESFDPVVHVVAPSFKPPASWPRDLMVDFGYTNAFSALWSAEDPDGRIYFYRELYGTQRKTRDWAHLIHDANRGEKLRSVITDWDRAERTDLEMHAGHSADECPDNADTKQGRTWDSPIVGTTAATKGVEMRGIQLVQARLERAGDGYPRVFFVKDMLACERDPRLVETKQPTCLEEEFPRYVWAKARSLTAGEVTLEQPVDRWNHSLDLVRYRVLASDAHLKPVSGLYGKSFSEQVG